MDTPPPRTHNVSRKAAATRAAQVETLRAKTGQLEAENVALEQRASRLERTRADLNDELRSARRELAALGDRNAELATAQAQLKDRLSDLEHRAKQVDEVSTRLARRTSRMISANMSAVAIEAVPFVGLAAIAGMTFVEVRDACLTLADTRELSALFSGESIETVPACGYSAREFLAVVRGNPETDTCEALAGETPEELKLECSKVIRPGEAPLAADSTASTAPDISRPGD